MRLTTADLREIADTVDRVERERYPINSLQIGNKLYVTLSTIEDSEGNFKVFINGIALREEFIIMGGTNND